LVKYRKVESQKDGTLYQLVFNTTPFYPEGGGQVGDRGTLQSANGEIIYIIDTKKENNLIIHLAEHLPENLTDPFKAEVHLAGRTLAQANHSATHLLHQALREVLGTHVEQKGSHVSPEALRFDFSHFAKLTQEELAEVERIVNKRILDKIPLQEHRNIPIQQALEAGAMALFGDKYGDVVRVVEVPGFSVELCGGSHVGNTAFVGSFRLTSEAGIGSGVRRIEAITGRAALDAAKQDRLTIERMAGELKTKAPQVEERLHQVLAEAKETAKELDQIRKEVSAAGAADIVAGKVMIGDVAFVAASVKASSIDELRDFADMGLDKLDGSGVVLVGAAMGDDKVNFVCKVSKDVVGKGVKAGNIVKAAAQVAGGNGGGRPRNAQEGGAEPSKLMDALKAAGDAVKEALNA